MHVVVGTICIFAMCKLYTSPCHVYFSLRAVCLRRFPCTDVHSKRASHRFGHTYVWMGIPRRQTAITLQFKNPDGKWQRLSTIVHLCHHQISPPTGPISPSRAPNEGVGREATDAPCSFQPGSAEAWVVLSPCLFLCAGGLFFSPSANINKTCQGTSSPELPESKRDILGACSQLFQPVHTAGVNCLSTVRNHFINSGRGGED